jgi:hypothetical protein
MAKILDPAHPEISSGQSAEIKMGIALSFELRFG